MARKPQEEPVEDELVETDEVGEEEVAEPEPEYYVDDEVDDEVDEDAPEQEDREQGVEEPPAPKAETRTPPSGITGLADSDAFTEEQKALLNDLMTSGNVDDFVKAQQLIARQTMLHEQTVHLQSQRCMADAGVTDAFKQEYAEELNTAMMYAPAAMKTNPQGIATIVGAVVADRAMRANRSLADEMEQAAKLLRANEPKTVVAKPGSMKPPDGPDPRTRKVAPTRTNRVSVDKLIAEVFGGE